MKPEQGDVKKIKVPADSLSGESLLPGSYMTISSLCHYMVEGTTELSGAFFIKTLISSTRDPPT